MNIWKRFVINVLASSQWIPIQIRIKLYNLMGIKTVNTEIRPGCFFNSEFVEIGSNCFINYFTQFHSGYDKRGTITLGEKCFIGMNVNFCTISHEMGDNTQRAGENIYKPIIVGNGTWVGANSVILPGINIGEGCVISAGSVVTKNCEPNGLYAGVPAKRIKELPSGNKDKEVVFTH